jgi:hypothetical protein
MLQQLEEGLPIQPAPGALAAGPVLQQMEETSYMKSRTNRMF